MPKSTSHENKNSLSGLAGTICIGSRSIDYVEIDASGGDIAGRNAASNEPVVEIVVAIDRSAAYIREYSPWENEVFSRTGDGDLYLQALISHVMPYVNANYRTLSGPGCSHPLYGLTFQR